MSRPPYPHPARSTGREQSGDLTRLDYLPLDYGDLLALQEELAVARLGRPRSQATGELDEADVARTFMELSALVAHVLAVYQRHYAGEAFISTARAASSLVRHARRLAYDPDPGLAASGHVVLFAKDGVSGTVAAGLPLASVPLGEIKAQDYETLDAIAVDAALNELEPLAARVPVRIEKDARTIRLQGAGHGIVAGDLVLLLVDRLWQGFAVDGVTEDTTGESTTVNLDRGLETTIDFKKAPVPARLLAHPALELAQFGADADPALFPPAAVKDAAGTPVGDTSGTAAKDVPRYRYRVGRPDGTAYRDDDIYLSEKVAVPLVGQHVLRTIGSTGTDSHTVLAVTEELVAAVTLEREAEESFTTHTVKLTATEGGGFESSLKPATVTQTVTSRISGTVSVIHVADRKRAVVTRPSLSLPARWLTAWAVDAPLATSEPNAELLGQPLQMRGQLAALTPGRALVFSDRAETVAQIVTISRAEIDAAADVTNIWWDPVGPATAHTWWLADLKVFGNVARVSHGRTVQETLGGSDGVAAFQRFALGQSPLTVLPGAAGGEPQLEVRVDEVRWQRVEDFSASAPDDRHYRSVTDEEGMTTIVFGDGRNGAVPPPGDKNVRASYRVGLGRAGDVEPRRLSRLKRAHPLLDRVVNVTPVSGGAEPADPDAIRSQSTRWIRTFDRAVSVADLADLALTMPGIARAAARADGEHGVVLVVATAAGGTPAPEPVRAFLDARRDTTVALKLLGPTSRSVVIEVDVEPDPTYLVELVKDAVRAALHGEAQDPGMFTFAARGLGQPAYLSEVYERLEAVPGVIGVRVGRFASRDRAVVTDLVPPADVPPADVPPADVPPADVPPADVPPADVPPADVPPADVIPADVDEWLHLAPNDLTVTIAGSKA